MRLRFLGTGTSMGVPVIGCESEGCLSTDSRDKRQRCAVIVEAERAESIQRTEGLLQNQDFGLRFLIDCGPDIRSQLLAAQVSEIDALLLTHAHGDHLFGLDDLRPLRWQKERGWRMPLLSLQETREEVERIFPWVFEEQEHRDGYLKLDHQLMLPQKQVEFLGVALTPIQVSHGRMPTVGWLMEAEGKSLAYFSDLKEICTAGMEVLKQKSLDVLVLGCLRDEAHPTHLNTQEAMALAAQLGAGQTWFTHLSHAHVHQKLQARLPEGMAVAYDGLEVSF